MQTTTIDVTVIEFEATSEGSNPTLLDDKCFCSIPLVVKKMGVMNPKRIGTQTATRPYLIIAGDASPRVSSGKTTLTIEIKIVDSTMKKVPRIWYPFNF